MNRLSDPFDNPDVAKPYSGGLSDPFDAPEATPPASEARQRAMDGLARGVSPDRAARQAEINNQVLRDLGARAGQGEAGFLGFAQGATFGTADEAGSAVAALLQEGDWGRNYENNLDAIRQRTAAAREDFPVTTTAAEIGGALPVALATPWAGAARAVQAGGKVAQVGTGAALAGTEGATYAFASGEGGDTMLESMEKRAEGSVRPGMTAAALGGAGTAAALTMGPAIQRFFRNRAAKRGGVEPAAFDEIANVVQADGSAASRVLDDPTAMLADTGPATAGLLDASIQNSGKAGTQARRMVDDRVAQASERVTTALNKTFGEPGASSSKALVPYGQRANPLSGLYERAYSQPIDYASEQGRALEAMINNRVPAAAIKEANELMRINGEASKQIGAEIMDDGTVVFRTMPDVRQIDYITRGLNQVADQADGAGKLGGTTPKGRAYSNLSRGIRDTLKDLVPEYRGALDAAASLIGQGKAREYGMELLRSSVPMNEARAAILRMGPGEKAKVGEGIREGIDEMMANVRRTMSDGDTGSREAMAALKQLSSRATREKVAMTIGEGAANSLFREIDSAARAFNLRANVATNSRTFGRQQTADAIKSRLNDGPINAIRSGEPLNASKGLAQALMGRTAGDKARISEEAYSDLVRALLTQGPEARKVAEEALKAPKLVVGPTEKYSRLAHALLGRAGITGAIATQPPAK